MHYYSILVSDLKEIQNKLIYKNVFYWRLVSPVLYDMECEQSEIKAVKDLPKLIITKLTADTQCSRQAAPQA